MQYDWQAWEVNVTRVEEFLSTCGVVLSDQDFDDALSLLPREYQFVVLAGQIDNAGLNNTSMLGLVRCLPIIAEGDYFVTTYTWDQKPSEAGRYAALTVFKNNHRLLISFSDKNVYYKVSKRSYLHYKGISAGELVVNDCADMDMIETLVRMMGN